MNGYNHSFSNTIFLEEKDMMFFDGEIQPSMVGCKLNDEELQRFLTEQGITMQIVDNSTRWCAFAQYYARTNGIEPITATSFSYILSLFMTGMGISASTEMYFKEEQIEYDLLDRLNEIKAAEADENKQVIILFDEIVKLYSENIAEYEYSTEQLNIRLTPSEMRLFKSLDGETNKDKFRSLLKLI